jgi:hypothetical protein
LQISVFPDPILETLTWYLQWIFSWTKVPPCFVHSIIFLLIYFRATHQHFSQSFPWNPNLMQWKPFWIGTPPCFAHLVFLFLICSRAAHWCSSQSFHQNPNLTFTMKIFLNMISIVLCTFSSPPLDPLQSCTLVFFLSFCWSPNLMLIMKIF